LLTLPAHTVVEEASGGLGGPPLRARLLLGLLPLLLSAAHETPLSVAGASLPMLPAPRAHRRRGGKRGLREAASAGEAAAAAAAAFGRPRDAAVGRVRELVEAARAHRRQEASGDLERLLLLLLLPLPLLSAAHETPLLAPARAC